MIPEFRSKTYGGQYLLTPLTGCRHPVLEDKRIPYVFKSVQKGDKIELLKDEPEFIPSQGCQLIIREGLDTPASDEDITLRRNIKTAIMLSRVDFPEPEGPMMAMNSPGRT